DLGEVGVAPGDQEAGDDGLPARRLALARERDRARRLQQREQRPAEDARLLAADDREGAGAQAVEVATDGGRRVEAVEPGGPAGGGGGGGPARGRTRPAPAPR